MVKPTMMLRLNGSYSRRWTMRSIPCFIVSTPAPPNRPRAWLRWTKQKSKPEHRLSSGQEGAQELVVPIFPYIPYIQWEAKELLGVSQPSNSRGSERELGVSINGSTPKWTVYKWKSQSKVDDLEVPLFQETPSFVQH